MMYGEALGELSAAPFLARDQCNVVQFDLREEALWVGTEGGAVGQMAVSGALEKYSSFLAHEGRVLGLRSVGEGAVSVSGGQLCLHASGGAVRMSYKDEVRRPACTAAAGAGLLQRRRPQRLPCSRAAGMQAGAALRACDGGCALVRLLHPLPPARCIWPALPGGRPIVRGAGGAQRAARRGGQAGRRHPALRPGCWQADRQSGCHGMRCGVTCC